MRRNYFALALCLSASPVAAHIIPIQPVKVEVKVDGDRARVLLRARAFYWDGQDVLSGTPPPENWPEEFRARAMDYVNERMVFKVDGSTVAPRLLDARQIQQPWQSDLEAEVVLRLAYDLPPGKVLSIRAEFQKEEHDRHIGMEVPMGVPRIFETHVSVLGRDRAERVLPLSSPEMEVPLGAARRGFLQKAVESCSLGAAAFAALTPLWLAVVAGLAARPSGRATWAEAGAALGAFAGGALLPLPFHAALPWAALALLGSVPWARPGSRRLWLALWGMAVLWGGRSLSIAASREALSMGFVGLSLPAFLAGAALAGAAAAGLCLAGAWVYRRQHRDLDAGAFARQWDGHRRLASLALAAAGAAQAVNLLKGG